MPKRLSPEQIKKIVAAQLDVDVADVKDNSRFVADFGADSLDTVELAMQFEDETGTTIKDDEFAKVSTVGELIAFLDRLTA